MKTVLPRALTRQVDAKTIAVAVISLIEGALILSRTAGDAEALDAAKVAARWLLP